MIPCPQCGMMNSAISRNEVSKIAELAVARTGSLGNILGEATRAPETRSE